MGYPDNLIDYVEQSVSIILHSIYSDLQGHTLVLLTLNVLIVLCTDCNDIDIFKNSFRLNMITILLSMKI